MNDADKQVVVIPRRPLSAILLVIFVCSVIVGAHTIVSAFRDMYVFPVSDMVDQQLLYFHVSMNLLRTFSCIVPTNTSCQPSCHCFSWTAFCSLRAEYFLLH